MPCRLVSNRGSGLGLPLRHGDSRGRPVSLVWVKIMVKIKIDSGRSCCSARAPAVVWSPRGPWSSFAPSVLGLQASLRSVLPGTMMCRHRGEIIFLAHSFTNVSWPLGQKPWDVTLGQGRPGPRPTSAQPRQEADLHTNHQTHVPLELCFSNPW